MSSKCISSSEISEIDSISPNNKKTKYLLLLFHSSKYSSRNELQVIGTFKTLFITQLTILLL